MVQRQEKRSYASGNRGVVYMKPGTVEVQNIPYPTLILAEQNRECHHGVILKV